jgi:hypothetical protein
MHESEFKNKSTQYSIDLFIPKPIADEDPTTVSFVVVYSKSYFDSLENDFQNKSTQDTHFSYSLEKKEYGKKNMVINMNSLTPVLELNIVKI